MGDNIFETEPVNVGAQVKKSENKEENIEKPVTSKDKVEDEKES